MAECVYPGCSARKTKSSLARKSFHRIPFMETQENLRKLWLVALRMDPSTTHEKSKGFLVCSDHFDPEDYHPKEQTSTQTTERREGLRKPKPPKKARIERTRLKSHAVPRTPTLLELTPFAKSDAQVPEDAVGLSHGAEGGESADELPDFRGAKSSTPRKSEPTQGAEKSQTALSYDVVDAPEAAKGLDKSGAEAGTSAQHCRQKRHPTFYLQSPPQPKPSSRTSRSGEYMARPPTWSQKGWVSTTSTLPLDTTAFERLDQGAMDQELADLSTSFGEISMEDKSEASADSGDASPEYRPSTQSSSTDDDITDDERNEQWDPERRWIVNESHLQQLFKFCMTCGQPIEQSWTVSKSSRLKVKWECLGQCKNPSWTSCPKSHQRTAENDVLISAGIFFTGATYTDIFEWAQLINLQIPQKTHYYNIQSAYLIPVVHAAYKDHNKKIIERLIQKSADGHRIELAGDGRSDSPGFSAKYTTYSFQDDETKEIVHFELVQVNEASSSVAMEVMGFERGLDQLRVLGVDVGLITTDRSPSIRKLMTSDKYKGVIQHEFDAWHVGKSVKKKLLAAAVKAPNRMLQRWIKAVNNHLFWSCESSKGDPEAVERHWKSLLHHVCGIHSWEEDNVTRRCRHRDYTDEEQEKKMWLTADSPPFNALKGIVMDPGVLRDLKQMAHFKHTGSLEIFHSSMLKYTPKRIHFFYDSMLARTKLAVLDHNVNVGRQQAITMEGALKWKYVEPKATRQWCAKTEFARTEQLPLRRKLVERLMIKVQQDPVEKTKKKRDPTQRKSLPRPNVARNPMPDKLELQAKSSERFKHHSSKPDYDSEE